MRKERSNIKLYSWRKQVDEALFQHSIAIPVRLCKRWRLPTGNKVEVKIKLKGKQYKGRVEAAKVKESGRVRNIPRLVLADPLQLELKQIFLASYVRSLERMLSRLSKTDIENTIPFAEFLDIEYDYRKKTFFFYPVYCQKVLYPEIFKFLTGSPALNRCHDELLNKKDEVHFRPWTSRELCENEIMPKDAIYLLIDKKHKKLYVGQSARESLKKLSESHPTISDWDSYLYFVLPKGLSKHLSAIEMILIKTLAYLLKNKRIGNTKNISEYALANDQINTRNKL